ncbi:ABC transporter ATP-binding protein [Methanomassiliicoccus luminyensis]|uniref:ABC transporter ATP-binding protein n=1 Tax=Methanomassiliicoccus luminyensis TaxID=1080712 RepID=UPI0003647480|nr:ABC transporter ATP-binding protein [Methanomassiliicoccus luminyensis]
MMLDIRGIKFAYRGREVLKDILLGTGVNDVLAILGPNGAGKTTLLKCINGLLKTKVGTILLEGEDLREMTRVEMAKRIGYVPQRADVSKMTVFDAVLLGRKPHITWDVSSKDLQVTKDIIRALGLDSLSLKYIDEISGGELQKVQIARALVQQPKVMLLDEPTSSLDLCNQHRIMRSVVDVVKGSDLTAVMTVHDLNLALRYADRFLMLKDGVIYAAGGVEVITPENIETVYDIPVFVETVRGRPMVVPA